jgi:D-alanyl-lipoteichoic acid acyltransferase DltB (MBOAT superfamily)
MIYLAGLVVTWLLTGLWHGANTTFILWGLWHGFFLFLHHLLKNPRKNLLKRFPQGIIKLFVGLLERIVVLMVVVVGWTVFRSADMEHATAYISRIFKGPLFTNPALDHPERLIIVVLFFLAEWVQRDRIHVLEFGPGRVPVWVRWSVYYLTMAAIFLFSANGQVFIYSMF